MSALIAPVWTRIDELVQAVWPTVTIGYRTNQIQQLNWRDMLERTQLGQQVQLNLATPYVLLQPGPVTDYDGLGMVRAYRVPFDLHRIESASASTNVAKYLEGQLEAFRDAFIAPNQGAFQVFERPILDVSAESPPNQLFLVGGYPYYAGTVSGAVVVWEGA